MILTVFNLAAEKFKLFIIHPILACVHVTPPTDEGHIYDGTVHDQKPYSRTLCFQTIFDSENRKDTVLQMGAQQHH